MNFELTPAALRDYSNAQPAVPTAFEKQLRLLVENLRHPSLRAKKYDESRGLASSGKSQLAILFPRKRRDLRRLEFNSPPEVNAYISRRPSRDLSIVTSSAYSSSEPTGMPMAMRLTFTPRGLMRREI